MAATRTRTVATPLLREFGLGLRAGSKLVVRGRHAIISRDTQASWPLVFYKYEGEEVEKHRSATAASSAGMFVVPAETCLDTDTPGAHIRT
jgi:hypothetical protein